jgi:hypothetical protein
MTKRGYRKKPQITRRCHWCNAPLPWWRENTCNDECEILAQLDMMGEWIE